MEPATRKTGSRTAKRNTGGIIPGQVTGVHRRADCKEGGNHDESPGGQPSEAHKPACKIRYPNTVETEKGTIAPQVIRLWSLLAARRATTFREHVNAAATLAN